MTSALKKLEEEYAMACNNAVTFILKAKLQREFNRKKREIYRSSKDV